MTEIYYPPSDNLNLDYVLWLLTHYGSLETYHYPPEPSGYVNTEASRGSTFAGKSPHETCILIKAELDWRLGICEPESYQDDRGVDNRIGHLDRVLGKYILDEAGRLGKQYRYLDSDCKHGLWFVSSGRKRRKYNLTDFLYERRRKLAKIAAARSFRLKAEISAKTP